MSQTARYVVLAETDIADTYASLLDAPNRGAVQNRGTPRGRGTMP